MTNLCCPICNNKSVSFVAIWTWPFGKHVCKKCHSELKISNIWPFIALTSFLLGTIPVIVLFITKNIIVSGLVLVFITIADYIKDYYFIKLKKA